MKCISVRDLRGSLSVSRAALLLGIGRSGYYKWLHAGRSDRSADDLSLREEIQRIAVEYPRYGYRRITMELRRRGYSISCKKVLRLMRLDNLLCVKKRFQPCTTNSNHGEKVYENLAKHVNVSRVNQLWVSDITYIQLQKEFVFLAVVLDVYSRRCIGWELGMHIDTRLTLSALHEALKTRRLDDLSGLVHHSDQGAQYASREYVECLHDHGIRVSMSRRGNPYDNAFAESFMKTLKQEEVYLNEYETFEDAMDNIERFIEQVYNQKRLHSSIGYKTPVEFEKTISLNNVP